MLESLTSTLKRNLWLHYIVKGNWNGKYHSVSKVVLFILFSFVALSHFEIPGAQRDKFTIKIEKLQLQPLFGHLLCAKSFIHEAVMMALLFKHVVSGTRMLDPNLSFQHNYMTCRWYHSNCRKWRGTKEPLDEGERWQWKSWLKTQYSKN